MSDFEQQQCDEFFTSCLMFSVLLFIILSLFLKLIHRGIVYQLSFSLAAPLKLDAQKTIKRKAKIQSPQWGVWNALILWNI